MHYFLKLVRDHMHSNRRIQPVPQDFIFALADLGIMPYQLLDHVNLQLPANVTQPPIAPAEHDDPPIEHLEGVLGGQLVETASRKKWVPAHFPDLPSKHTYQYTPIYTKRENDARRIREMATEEGILAEQAMRKLLINGGHGNAKIPFQSKSAERAWNEAMAGLTKLDEEQRAREGDEEFEDFGERQQEDYDTAMLVNYERRYWRSAARGA
jgi:transcription initiation factor TFIID subunit 8